MARFGVALLFGLFTSSCFHECSSAATMAKETRTMRREELVHGHTEGVRIDHQGALVEDGSLIKRESANAKHKRENSCEWVLVRGDAGARGCPVNSSTVREEDLCKERCKDEERKCKRGKKKSDEECKCVYKVLEANGDLDIQREIEDEEDESPYGCFSNGASNKFFYNPSGSDGKDKAIGTPWCKRKEYVEGWSNPGGRSRCPEFYKVIDGEKTETESGGHRFTNKEAERDCGIAAKCLGKTFPEEDQVGKGDDSLYDVYPEGCFLPEEKDEEEVRYNPPRDGMELPEHPRGTPMCIFDEDAYNKRSPSPPPQ